MIIDILKWVGALAICFVFSVFIGKTMAYGLGSDLERD